MPSGFSARRAAVEPGAGELVVACEVVELVPVVVDRIDLAVVGPQQLAAELEIIGRVGEDHVDGGFGQALHQFDAVADEHAIKFIHRHLWNMSPQHLPVKKSIESNAYTPYRVGNLTLTPYNWGARHRA